MQIKITTGKLVIATHGPNVLCSPQHDTSQLSPYSHGEADTKMLLHTAHAVSQGFEKVTLRMVDINVVVLAVAVVPRINIKEQSVAFGTGEHLRSTPAHEIATYLGPEKSKALPMFHMAIEAVTPGHHSPPWVKRKHGIHGKQMMKLPEPFLQFQKHHCT